MSPNARFSLPLPLPPDFWGHTWVWTATVGTAILIVHFGVYEIVERYWLLERFSLEEIFTFHLVRGVSAAILLGVWSAFHISRAGRKFERALREAYRSMERAMEERTRALGEAQAFTERVFDALKDRLVVLDRDGNVVKANRVAIESCGGRDPTGRPCSLFQGCSFDRDDCVARSAMVSGRPVIGQFVRRDACTGRVYAIDAYPVPDLEGNPTLVIESARDITEAKQLEAQIRNQEKLAALGMLAAGIAHDVGNPLASMSSELEMLEGETDPERIRESLSVLREHVERIKRTLREMADFARRRGEDVTDVAVEVAVRDAMRMVRHDPRARRVRIVTEIDPALPTLRMVEDHLVMVLVNLLLNAFDAMPGGGRIAIRARCAEARVVLEVEDTGVGMTEEVRRRAVEPLFTTKPGGHGTGLGLSVCLDVVRSVGGTFDIDSAPGRGTTVRIAIPVSATREDRATRELHA